MKKNWKKLFGDYLDEYDNGEVDTFVAMSYDGVAQYQGLVPL